MAAEVGGDANVPEDMVEIVEKVEGVGDVISTDDDAGDASAEDDNEVAVAAAALAKHGLEGEGDAEEEKEASISGIGDDMGV
jgi:hypothetical protein